MREVRSVDVSDEMLQREEVSVGYVGVADTFIVNSEHLRSEGVNFYCGKECW